MKTGFPQLLKTILAIAMMVACTAAVAAKDVAIEPHAVGYTVGGTVTGLLDGSIVVLQNNGGSDLTVNVNGPFTFANKLPDGGFYDVTVFTQPTSPDLICNVTNGSGTIAGANITDVQVDCVHSACPGGVGDEDVVVTSYDYNSGKVIDCTATNSITLGSDVFVLNDTTLNMRSPHVSIQGDMAVEFGSRLYISSSVLSRLNDTGIIYCADDTFDGWICPISTHPGQDGDYGRDVTHDDDSDGHAGFSFTKLDANGGPLPASATSWSCVKDNVTGLIWESKTDDGGLHDRDSFFLWYNTDPDTNGGHPGYSDLTYGLKCYGYDIGDPATYCNTQAYTARVNQAGLCGYNDWRMPHIKELENIVSRDRYNPAIDTDYFPNTLSPIHNYPAYWSASSSASATVSYPAAWSVNYSDGNSAPYIKNHSKFVRLVRGGQ